MAKKAKNRPNAAAQPNAVGIVRLARAPLRARGVAVAAAVAPDPNVPVAAISAVGGPVTVSITFGQAQHAKYTIQLFDPSGNNELARLSGINTDQVPDEFTLQGTPGQLDQHMLQWSGLVSAFSPAPGQQFSVTFEVSQNGAPVPGGRVVRTGALSGAQAFIGVLRLVTR